MIPTSTLPTTIRTTVSQSAITRVSRLFNGTASDVLAELFQNARRAGATCLKLETTLQRDRLILSIRDDGYGIDNPADLITLGQSGWDDNIATREDPAGMGMFSLAGHHVGVRSYSPAHAQGWSVVIDPDALETSKPATVKADTIRVGTEIIIVPPDPWHDTLDKAVAHASLYYPLPVTLNGETQAQSAWLADAVRIEEWQGSRIGVFHERCHTQGNPTINFHGLTVACDLPTQGEVDRSGTWSVRVEIGDTPSLQLVLPARKEMVANAALEDLRAACRRTIFEAIRIKGAHRLSFRDYETGRELGVDLPQATPYLFTWTPAQRDHASTGIMGRLVTNLIEPPVLIMPELEADLGQCARRVLQGGALIGCTLVEPVPKFAGYPWYDAIEHLHEPHFVIEKDGIVSRYDERGVLDNDLASGTVDSLAFAFAFTASASKNLTTLGADVLAAFVDDLCTDVDATTVLIAQAARVTVP